MNANTDKTLNSPSDSHQDALFHEALRKATPAKLAAAIELLSQEPKKKNQCAYLPKPISDLVENDIRDAAFELVAITKAISEWSANQSVSVETAVLDMDVGDIISLSSMAVQRAQRIVDLSNKFESSVTYLEVKA